MGETTKIQWANHTFSPWIGCAKVSAGCKNCYAEADNPARISRGRGLELWGEGAARQRKAESGWAEPLRWFRAAVRDGVRRRVFCASQGDVFEDRRDLDAARARLWLLIEDTSKEAWMDSTMADGGLDWLLLTKRPENVMRLIPDRWRKRLPSNVWIGASVENADVVSRVDALREIPARVRFLSLEPLLGPIPSLRLDGIHWLIIGGESGKRARPCDVAWISDLRDQGLFAGVPVFVKQLGARPTICGVECRYLADTAEWEAGRFADPKGGDPAEWPAELRVRELPTSPAKGHQ